MGKLTDMATEDLSLADKVKINLRRVGLASVGLVSIVDSERSRLYRQIQDMGESYGGANTVVGRLSLLGTGTVNLLLEESQRVFDELVEEGEQALSRNKQPALTAAKPAPVRINQPRPVAKSRPPVSATVKTESKVQPKSPAKVKAKAKPQPQVPAARLSLELKQRLEQATQLVSGLELDARQSLEVVALTLQVKEGDVSGRRPAKNKPQAQAEFDARRQLKGMNADAALTRLEAVLKRLLPATAE